MKLKIFHRGLIFISIPLFFEIFVFSVLINLNEQAESAARRAQKSRLINDQINLIIGDCYQISRITKGISLNGIAPKELEDGGQMEDGKLMPTVLSAAGWVEAYSHYRQAARKYLQDMAQLKLLVADNPENLAIVERSEHAALEADRLIARLRKQIPRTSYSDISKILTENRHQLDALIVQVLSPEVINIAMRSLGQSEQALFWRSLWSFYSRKVWLGGLPKCRRMPSCCLKGVRSILLFKAATKSRNWIALISWLPLFFQRASKSFSKLLTMQKTLFVA
jgi:hypothetical protein